MANLISLGRNCCVAYNIQKYNNNKYPTHFFDLLRTDFKCVLYILNSRTIDMMFNSKNFIVDNKSWKIEGNIGITLKNFIKNDLCLLFHHDVITKQDGDDGDDDEMTNKLNEFADKYKRRFNRLINLIETQTDTCFIYHNNLDTDFDYDDCIEFNRIIKSINKNNNYVLVLLMNDTYDNIDYEYIKNEYYIKINLKHFAIKDIANDWTHPIYDWMKVINLIQDIINNSAF
jgi:hypothetical protein